MQKKIIIKPAGNQEIINRLKNELNINDVLANLLAQRGISTFEEAKAFFRPDLANLYDPYLMKDMDKAVSRLDKARSSNERILIYGDYDVDGTTSVALVYSFLKEFHTNIDFYIPNRYTEGYGVSKKGIEYAEKTGASLIIALDCGIKATEQVELAKQKKIDFIICDHHTAGETIPDAVAVLDPKRPDCNYPFKELSGCGVGFKFMQAFSNRNSIPFERLTNYIDLVVVSIASDIVPIIDENRILSYFGLKKLNENPLTGLKAIKKIANVENKEMTISDCVFRIGPRINAAGRIESGAEAVNLLIAENFKSAYKYALQIEDYNTDRKDFDRTITHEALRTIGNSADLRNRNSTVVYNKDWHKGVVGIVASRLTETYYRPTIVLTESNGFISGSARSVSDFDLYAAIDSCSHLLKNFGGHKFAAGLTIKHDNLDEFIDCFEKYVSKHITEVQKIPVVKADAALKFSDITPKFFKILKQFAPFGPGNLNPVFYTANVKDTGDTVAVGQTREHLKISFKDESGGTLSGIAFSMAHYLKRIRNAESFTICYIIEENHFKGKTTLQARLKEINFKPVTEDKQL